jgi:Tol biopolymer transport system component
MTPAFSNLTRRSRTVLRASSTLAASVFNGIRALARSRATICVSIASILPLSPTLAAGANVANTPSHWTPAGIASSRYESTPTFSPEGREMIFMSADADFTNYRLMSSRCEGGAWSKPASLPFAAALPAVEGDPFLTPDGKRLYYISTRHDPKHEDFDIYSVERLPNGAWSEPSRLPMPVRSPASELLPRQDAQGHLYFGSARDGGVGQGDIYVAMQDASGEWRVTNVGPPVNTAAFEYEAEISHDGKTMVVVAHRTHRSHLYLYKSQSGRWVDAGEISAKQEEFQVGPLLSPKADRVLFAQRDGVRSGEIFLLDLVAEPDPTWPPRCR